MIKAVSIPRNCWTAATKELSSATIPVKPKAAVKRVLKGIRAPTIAPAPTCRIRKPSIVFTVPFIQSEKLLFRDKSPMNAIIPRTKAGFLRILIT